MVEISRRVFAEAVVLSPFILSEIVKGESRRYVRGKNYSNSAEKALYFIGKYQYSDGSIFEDIMLSYWTAIMLGGLRIKIGPDRFIHIGKLRKYVMNIHGSSQTATDIEREILSFFSLSLPIDTQTIDLTKELIISQFSSPFANRMNYRIFGILSLRAAGVPEDDLVITQCRNAVLDSQNSDGGWSMEEEQPSVTDITSFAVLAGFEGEDFLWDSRNLDYGWPFGGPIVESNVDSTSWAVLALGLDTQARNFLLQSQQEDGSFSESMNTGKKILATLFAIMALWGSFPFRV